MVYQMAGDDVGQSAYSDVVVAREATAFPSVGQHILEERDGRETYSSKLVHVCRPRDAICIRTCGGDSLIEAGQR